MSEWDERAVATLRGMWADGKTTREIAATLKCSRDAVIGKAHRLGLPKHASVHPHQTGRAPSLTGQKQSGARERLTAFVARFPSVTQASRVLGIQIHYAAAGKRPVSRRIAERLDDYERRA
jgi:hypothetical protein